METRSSATIIIIGDEILKGQTKDTNSHFLCQQFYECGVKVSRIIVIPDDIDIIAEEVLSESRNSTFVITSGGVGPTHDDVTYAGVAKAFEEKLVLKRELQDAFKNMFSLDDKSSDALSLVPESAVIHHTRNAKNKFYLPVVSIKNVYTLPGIPSYLENCFLYLKDLFFTKIEGFYQKDIYVNKSEFVIARILDKAVKEYENQVKFGSYPDIDNVHYKVKLTLEADSEDLLDKAEAFLRSLLPDNTVVSKISLQSRDTLEMLLDVCDKSSKNFDSDLSNVINESNNIFEECLERYSLEKMCLSFNGGKDCTALLHFIILILIKKYKSKVPKLNILYVKSKQSFPQIEAFVKLSVQRYNLNLITYDPPIKDALHRMKVDHPEIEAILMGTRHTDPHCSDLQPMQVTDSDWPQFIRIAPLLHWNYQHVWKFLRSLDVPYCSLYDKGYTSLGCLNNTIPNEKLLSSTKDGETFYLPAYLLKDPTQEREGRNTPL